jgi:hypothetical protein
MTWLGWELELLEELVGCLPSGAILKRLNSKRLAEGLPPRSYASLAIKCGRLKMKLKLDADDRLLLGYAPLNAWANGLGLSAENIRPAFRKMLRRKRYYPKDRSMVSRVSIDEFLSTHLYVAIRCDPAILEYLELNKTVAALNAIADVPDELVPTRGKRIVRRKDTGEIFPTIALAAKKTFQARITIHRSLKDGKPRNGIDWEYVNR